MEKIKIFNNFKVNERVEFKDASPELKAFKLDFEMYTKIKVDGLIENREFFHWKRLVFSRLNCEDLRKISDYIIHRFSTPGIYTHLSVELVPFDNQMCLTVDSSNIKKFIINK